MEKKKVAIVLVRGIIGASQEIKDTLKMLNLQRKNSCVIVPAVPSFLGMLRKVKDFVTYGELDAETEKQLVDSRGKKNSDGSLKKFFRLHPPRGGFDTKGTKVPFSVKGTLGNRGKKINDLIKKML